MEGQVTQQEHQESGRRKRTRQQIMVPFLWENEPGMPKKDWKPSRPPPPPSPTPPTQPVNFIVSIPFKWEEKPGTPLRTFTPEDSVVVASKPKWLPPPPAYSQVWEYDDHQHYSDDEDDDDDDDDDDRMWKLDHLASSTQTTDRSSSLSSAPSLLLANPIVPQSSQNSPFPSPTTSSISTTYATGSMSPAGNSFLEQLFPLHPPTKSSLSGKASCSSGQNNAFTQTEALPTAEAPKKFHCADNDQTVVNPRPLTLGELIMLSRRTSYVGSEKAIPLGLGSLSSGFNEKGLGQTEEHLGCGILKAANSKITKLLAGKGLLELKL